MIVIDVEIAKAIQGRDEERLSGIEYCDGWRDFAGMGVAVVCTYDMRDNLSRCFFSYEMEELQKYVEGQETGGFNTRRFDLPLLKVHGIEVDQEKHYDALEQIWIAQDLDPDNFNFRTHGGWSLDNIMQATFGIGKSGNGAMAPVWWQQGKQGRVVDYCLRDVWLEAKLISKMKAGGDIKSQGRTVTFWDK